MPDRNEPSAKKKGRLVLMRRQGESILIGDDIKITLTRVWAHHGKKAKILIEAPVDLHIDRAELKK